MQGARAFQFLTEILHNVRERELHGAVEGEKEDEVVRDVSDRGRDQVASRLDRDERQNDAQRC